MKAMLASFQEQQQLKIYRTPLCRVTYSSLAKL